MPETPGDRYTASRQALHWIAALLIISMFPLGSIMARTDSDTLRTTLYGVHAAIGLLIAVLAVVRIVLRRRDPVGPPPGLPRWNRVLRENVHRLALFVPLVLALTGVGTIAQNDLGPILQSGGARTVPATLDEAGAQSGHRLIARIYIAILVLHVAGVVRHQIGKGDVLSRMGVRAFAGKGGREGSTSS